MHGRHVIEAALALGSDGASSTAIARELNVPRRTVSGWLAGATPRAPRDGDRRCDTHDLAALPPAYPYLLGLYLGDGCITVARSRTPKLRIALDAAYPGIIAEARWAIGRVRGVDGNSQSRPRHCVEVYSYWSHWPCLFPQHAPGKKHERDIELVPWQADLVDLWPWELLRGLIHADGCRFENTGRNWRAPRYSFKQRSADIRRIYCSACARLGVRFTEAPDTVYVSRQRDVAILDRFVGAKH